MPATLQTFRSHASTQLSAVDVSIGMMADVSIIEAGEAKGHGILVTQKSLEGAVSLLQGKKLPAYITHVNAMGDRLTSEIGYFSGFYLDGSRIRARKFQALESFRKYKAEQYEQLFEMARILPENFGISLVFEARLFWELEGGEEEEYMGDLAKPEDSLYDLPSVEMLEIQSADFVDNPAANSSLFSNPKSQKENVMQTELTTAASEVLEKQKAEEATESSQPVAVEEAPKKKSGKKKLSESSEKSEESTEVSAEFNQVEDLENRLIQRDQMVGTLAAEVEELKAQVEILKGLQEGAEEIEEDFAEEIPAEKTNAQLKDEAVKSLMEDDSSLTRSAALLQVGKKNPELFNL